MEVPYLASEISLSPVRPDGSPCCNHVTNKEARDAHIRVVKPQEGDVVLEDRSN
jgi:hypothetical protein